MALLEELVEFLAVLHEKGGVAILGGGDLQGRGVTLWEVMVPSFLFTMVDIRTGLFLLSAETILDEEGGVFIGLTIFLTA